MPHPADLVLDANYAGPFAADGEYFAPGIPLIAGQGLACRVMRGGRQAGLDIGGMDMRPSIDTETLKVRVREVARPLRGGAFHLREERAFYRVMAEPDCLDRHRREWTCEALRLSDIVIPPPFAAVTGRGVAGAPVRGVSISAAAIGRGRAGAISLLQILSAPVMGRGVAGGLARAVAIDAPATGAGRAYGELDVQGIVQINAPATGMGIAGGLLRTGLIDGQAAARAIAGGLTRAVELAAPATGRGRAFAALEAQGVILIDAAATGRGVAGTLTREAPLAALASGRAVAGGIVRNVPLAALASARGAAGGLSRATVIDASAAGRGSSGGVLRHVFLTAGAIGRGAAASVDRAGSLNAVAVGTGVAGTVVGEAGATRNWTPEDYAGALGHWYDASDGATLELSGLEVVSWADKSGDGHDLSQATPSRRGALTLETADFNDLPTVAFPTGGGMASATKATGLISSYIVDGFSSSLGLSMGSVGATAGWSLPANVISSVRVPASTLTTANVLHRLNGEALSNTWDDGGATLAEPITAFFAGRVLSYGQGTDYGRIFDAGGDFTLSNRSSDWGRTANKRFAELIIVRGFLATSEMEIFEGYLAHKWGLAGALPEGHPYKENPPVV